MNEEKTGLSAVAKKPYKKPEVREVKLRPEEAVLGNCKVTSNYGPAGSGCTSVTSCYSIGS